MKKKLKNAVALFFPQLSNILEFSGYVAVNFWFQLILKFNQLVFSN